MYEEILIPEKKPIISNIATSSPYEEVIKVEKKLGYINIIRAWNRGSYHGGVSVLTIIDSSIEPLIKQLNEVNRVN